MKVGLAQINPTLGDFSGNAEKIQFYCQQAAEDGCDLVVFPELALMGYSPNDLLERLSVVDAQLAVFRRLKIPKGLAAIVGLVTKTKYSSDRCLQNSIGYFDPKGVVRFFHKQLLPSYDVFDEARHFLPGDLADNIITLKKQRLLLTICEDIWGWSLPHLPLRHATNPLAQFRNASVDLIINISASPYTDEKMGQRKKVAEKTCKFFRAPLIYVNLVGAQDEIVFDGASQVFDQSGRLLHRSPFFCENFSAVTVGEKKTKTRPRIEPEPERIQSIYHALVLGIRDFCAKTGIERCHLGLSGGIDSAVVASLAVAALGREQVVGLTLPGPYSSPESRELAEELARNLGLSCLNFSVENTYEHLLQELKDCGLQSDFGVPHENLQARIRGMVLMFFANQRSSLLLTTGNKSELATGYATLYGDMCGGLAPIGDLTKKDVYALADYINSHDNLIPKKIISRAPSAELRPNQKDQDSLPPYDVLDQAVHNIIALARPAKSEAEKFVLTRSYASEFKRWQAPPILKVTRHAFGRGRRLPIAHRARD